MESKQEKQEIKENLALNENAQEVPIETNQDELTAEQAAEQMLRDAEVQNLAASLDDGEADFDPLDMVDAMPEEMQQAALKQVGDVLETDEGATSAAADGIDYLEELLQEHCHEEFKIKDGKKKSGVKRLAPLIQKYAPNALGLLGEYKTEVMAALWAGSFMFSSVKQIKALNQRDAEIEAKNNPQPDEEKQGEIVGEAA